MPCAGVVDRGRFVVDRVDPHRHALQPVGDIAEAVVGADAPLVAMAGLDASRRGRGRRVREVLPVAVVRTDLDVIALQAAQTIPTSLPGDRDRDTALRAEE